MSVGIVVVCHSATLADGIAELAHAMSSSTLRLALAAGIDDPQHSLGTDPLRVIAAIQEVDSPDGVLVLMDLGSAVLSAELALDMLPPEQAARVRLCEAPLVEGVLAAAVQAVAGADLETVAREAVEGLVGKRAHLHAEVPVTASIVGVEPADGPSAIVRVGIAHGIHARPAARIVQTVAGYTATVTVANRTTGSAPVSAASVNSLVALGARYGHELVIRASGPEADEAVKALQAFAEAGFGDPLATEAPAGVRVPDRTVREAVKETVEVGGALRGLAGSPGVGFGPLHLIQDDAVPVQERRGSGPEAEGRRLTAAIAAADGALRTTAERAGATEVADIIAAQRQMLADPVLLEAAVAQVAEAGIDARSAWLRAVRRTAASLRDTGDPYLAERAADVEALGRDVATRLDGGTTAIGEIDGVVAATDLSPAQVAELDPTRVTGVVTALGSPSSHTAIIARTLGIPAVVGIGPAVLSLPPRTIVIVDGDAGLVVADPGTEELDSARRHQAEVRQRRELSRQRSGLPATTSDGVNVVVRANIGSVADARLAGANGAAGSGLVRTEFIFLNRADAPTEDEQASIYADICRELPDETVVLRTLDVGGDKPIPYLPQEETANPYLGRRGIRLALASPAVLETQLRALLRTAADHPVHIMLPMVTTLEEITEVRTLLEEQRELLASRGVAVPPDVALGVMVETPALALKIDTILPSVEFLSIGTNDLVQYTTAAERGNATVAHLYDPLDPAVLRLIGEVCDKAGRAGVTVAVCGSAAEDELALTVLIGLGVRELSVPPPRVPEVKELIRALDAGRARRIATMALNAPSAAAVRQLVALQEVGPR